MSLSEEQAWRNFDAALESVGLEVTEEGRTVGNGQFIGQGTDGPLDHAACLGIALVALRTSNLSDFDVRWIMLAVLNAWQCGEIKGKREATSGDRA